MSSKLHQHYTLYTVFVIISLLMIARRLVAITRRLPVITTRLVAITRRLVAVAKRLPAVARGLLTMIPNVGITCKVPFCP